MADLITIQDNATIERRKVSPQVRIQWDWQTNEGPVMFDVQEIMSVNGEVIRMLTQETLATSISEMTQKTFDIELPDGSVVQLSGALVMLAFKKAFEDLVAEAP